MKGASTQRRLSTIGYYPLGSVITFTLTSLIKNILNTFSSYKEP